MRVLCLWGKHPAQVRQLAAHLRGKGLERRLELLHLSVDEPREVVPFELLARLALLLGRWDGAASVRR